MVVQTEAPTHKVGQTVTIWFDVDHVYVGTVTAVGPYFLTVHLFEHTARVKVNPSLAF